ncbi:disks large homolog 5 isoform X3 [Nasonia vitripennis]|uniref:Disks large homolog 5 n=1 Tax=Nasonia vitripennis TaxID=7425 RepID=A0A7M7IRX0_NASVI|nr:disks large homolog 5 isoform X3 [Nasonia vitripennis]
MESLASGASSLDSAGSSDGALNVERDSGGCDSVGSAVSGPECRRDYERLQAEYQLLSHKHSDTIKRCEHTMKELEYYRSQHIAAMSQAESTSVQERGKYGDLLTDNQRLDREVQALQKELSEVRMQNQDAHGADGGNSDAMNQHYLSALRKYDAIKDEYETLRKRYDDVITSHSSAVNKLELAQEEAARLKKQYEEVVQERNSTVRERNGLKQQCTAAIRQWDIALRERNEYREALAKVSQQHEEAVKEINQAMVSRMKASKEIKRLTEERNAALHEYSLIMGERDNVHHEMETLGNDLSQAYAKVTHLENENKQLVEEKKTLSYQIETLRREISSALHDRDEALKECNELRQKFGDYSEASNRDRKNRLELHSYNIERDVASKEAEKESNPRDYAKREKERMDNLDQANLELDKLRKFVDTLQADLEEAVQEAEVSKRRRDWAFSERDKIVLERESIRTLCDRLRKERDRAVSDLANALRDSDDIKKQRNEASKELKDLKEKIESGDHSLRTSQYGQSVHDSDSEWDAVTVHLDLNRMSMDSDRDLGLMLVGGRDNPYYPDDTGIYVAQVAPGSVIENKLRVNDCILRVNNMDCSSVSTRMIIDTLRSCNAGSATLTIRRRRLGRRSLRTTQLPVGSVPHGITLEIGIYIAKISPGSLAAKDGYLAVGDRVLNINSKPMEGVTSSHEAMTILNDTSTDVLTITTLKGIPLTASSSADTLPIDGSFSPEKQKMVNSCSQTEQERMMLKASSDDYDRRCMMSSNFGDRSVYKVSKSLSNEKTGISNAWENFREKIDIVRGRRHSKDRDDKKKSHRNSSPNTFEQEQDAIAKLDSVIESYHKKTNNGNNGVLKRSKRRGVGTNGGGTGSGISGTSGVSSGSGTEKSAAEKNGGTWPKARIGPLIQNGTGTILHPRKTKERLPLSVLLNNPPKYESTFNYNRISNPIPLANFSTIGSGGGAIGSGMSSSSNRHTVYKAVESPLPSFTKSTQLHSQKAFVPSAVQFKDIGLDKANDGNLSSALAPSETSIDFSMKSGRGDIDYYGKSKRTATSSSNKYTPLGHDSSQVESMTHNRVHSQLYTSASSGGVPRVVGPEYSELEGSGSSSDSEGNGEKEASHSGSSTPCNTPEASRKSTVEPLESSEPERDQSSLPTIRAPKERERDRERDRELRASASVEVRTTQEREREIRNSASLDINIRKPELRTSLTLDGIRNSLTGTGTLTRAQINQAATTLQRQNATVRSPTQEEQNRNSKTPPPNEPRYLFIEMRKCSNLGISLVGGNGVGIFVHSVQPGCLAEEAGLHRGDRILEYNGIDLRQATAEQAALELARPADKVTLIAQYMPERYNEVKDKPGDSFYVKAMFDRTGELGDSLQLKFHKDDILYVDNTMFNGTPGHWRAWLIDQTGRRQTRGIIPSKFKVEEELLLRRSLGDLETDAGRRGTTSARRSFFRRKKHQRSSSRDSKELSQLTGVNMGWYSDSGTLNEENLPLSYQRVERLDYPTLRPVLIIGPLNECVATKLLQEFPGQFTRCLPEAMHCSQATLEQGLRDSLYVDYRKKGSYFECTTVQAVKEICEKNSHCILDISIASLERLHRHQIYPIVLLIKFKNTKQIKEVKDSRYPSDKVSAKAAKEMYEQALKLEAEYRHYINAVIPAGVNIAYICTQVKASVDEEQSKALWVPRGLP